MKYSILLLAVSFLFVGFALVATPDVASAQAGGLVPCSGPDCNMCHVAQLAEKVINFFVQISFVIAALLFAYAGFLFFTGGSDPGKITTARTVLTNTLVGIIIILTAWLVVNVIVTTLTGQGVNPFTQVLCQSRIQANEFQDIKTPSSGSGVQVTGSEKEEPKTFKWSGRLEVEFENGQKGIMNRQFGPFTSSELCNVSFQNPIEFIPGAKSVKVISSSGCVPVSQ